MNFSLLKINLEYLEVEYLQMLFALCIIFLPFLGFLITIVFGRYCGSRGTILITLLSVGFSFLFALLELQRLIRCGIVFFILGPSWIETKTFILQWTFVFDTLSVIMLVVVTFISFLVHLYSISYMRYDPHLLRFLSYLSLFTFFMLFLVTSGNFLQLFAGWEGVGLASYLLINFWSTRIQANKAALKAVIVNKFGDFGLFIAILFIYDFFGSLDFSIIFSITTNFEYLLYQKINTFNLFQLFNIIPFFNILLINVNSSFNFFSYIDYFSVISFFLLIAAIGKSAQMGLHTWLPDAMEGPTPVSALIHAATMVTAGVFLLVRCSPILEQSEFVLFLIMIIGGLTAFFGGFIGLVQNDIKKVIAYSTCSQLGYMVFSCGMSNYSLAMFHLVNHAFFKALLFLCAGSIIHGLANEQDMRRMGGLVISMPLTYILLIIGSLALMGFPFLTGFYSKDVILETAASIYLIEGFFIDWLGILAAFCTAFYSIRLLYLVFLKMPMQSKKIFQSSHESDIFIMFPLLLLGICSLFIGYLLKDFFIGLGTPAWFNSIFIYYEHTRIVNSEFLPINKKLIPLIFSFFGSLSAFIIYKYYFSFLNFFKKNLYFYIFYNFLVRKWNFDTIYNYFFVLPILNFGYNFGIKVIDQGFIQYFGAKGLINLFNNLSFHIRGLQSGYIYHYIFKIFTGFILILLILLI